MTIFTVEFQPIGKRIQSSGDDSLLTLAQDAGISITALCGGAGFCGACQVRCLSGQLTDIEGSEQDVFSPEQLSQGWRLACMAFPRSDISIDIPPESMTTSQRLQIEGSLRDVSLLPSVHLHPFALPEPNGQDLRADWERLTPHLPPAYQQQQDVPLPVLTQFSSQIRAQDWTGVALLGGEQQVVGFLSAAQNCYGVAIDIGTTKMAAFLVNLTTGDTVGKLAAMNPQVSYGEDVISRIAYANQGITQQKTLQTCLVDAINQMILSLCQSAEVEQAQIGDYVVVGNTAEHHLFAGLPVRQLGHAPYVAAVRQALRFPAREIGLLGAPNASVYMPPNIAGYVGADHIAMLLASNLKGQSDLVIALDIGTNTEVSLAKDGKMVSCSCASGPAFEGAHIHAGMRAAPGAIERARFFAGDWHLVVIDNQPPVGLCGSGILDVVAALLESGQIDATGRFTQQAVRRVPFAKGDALVLVPGERSGTGKDILVTRGDIREIQLAKAAIRAGIDALVRATGTVVDKIDQFLVAGAFGTYLSVESAVRIGMFPALPLERFHQIGNAAGAGALEMLLSTASRSEAEALLDRLEYIELTTDPGFMSSYVDAIGFDNNRKEN